MEQFFSSGRFIGTDGIWPPVKPIGISRPPHVISRAICSKIVPPTLSKPMSTPSPPVACLIRSRRFSVR
jgi:hypothetical protein